jgi:hypothetical protein
VRADVAINRMRASPPRGKTLPTPSEPVRAPARKSGGAFLPTARQAGPSHRDRRRCHGNRVPRTGTFARRRACLFSTDLRPQHPPRPKAWPWHRRGLSRRVARRQRHAATPLDRKASLHENDLAFHPGDRSERGKAAPA